MILTTKENRFEYKFGAIVVKENIIKITLYKISIKGGPLLETIEYIRLLSSQEYSNLPRFILEVGERQLSIESVFASTNHLKMTYLKHINFILRELI